MKKLDYKIVDNTRVYGLKASVIASGYPMTDCINPAKDKITPADRKRAKKLGGAKIGSGHDCYLKGIVVQCDLTLSEKAWPELQRYHFIDIVSSMSTMHMLPCMDVHFVGPTDCVIGQRFLQLVEDYNKAPSEEKWLRMIYSYPSGLLLTARITTNYLQLKTIYAQRKAHRLPEWHAVCDWIESLPYAKELGVV
ncbi:hypothetical protein [Megasphaera massiliensis]|jgi:hypothetical protein|uniref:hypothetical protein n=1 Tax=Megasphaera massiliensis TaxID=1232428 RepID=UPI0020459BD9|nr:hypothetical protein [uncultured Megasphaera sp.]DAH87861.1 MAG TPA: hypothetical protein [Bacteriophage sp.]